jgi:ribosomal protein S11
MLAIIHVYFTKNNIFFVLRCSVTNKVKIVLSSKVLGFSKPRREVLQVIQEAILKIKNAGFEFFVLKIKGFSRSRSLLLKEFLKNRVNIIKIIDVGGTAFNGCRLPNRRRI